MSKMFIVSNNPALRKRLNDCLSECSVEVLKDACSSEEAIERNLRERPRLAVIDLFVPGTTGLDLLKTMRKVNDKLRVIIISEMRTKSIMERAFRFGADDILTIPFSNETFVSCVLHRLPLPTE